jgi:hypothetical protein
MSDQAMKEEWRGGICFGPHRGMVAASFLLSILDLVGSISSNKDPFGSAC